MSLEGQRFTRWAIMGFSHSKGCVRFWLCQCDCGTQRAVNQRNLVDGLSRSCGCLQKEKAKISCLSRTKHGMKNTIEYNSWKGMLDRCLNPQNKAWNNYGNRGITVCDFLQQTPCNLTATIGARPPETSLDRIDNDQGYHCGTCDHCISNGWSLNIQWGTRTQQSRNRRGAFVVTMQGVTKHIAQWADEFGINKATLRSRIQELNWPEHKWLSGPRGKSWI